ncbi:hypothetical protein HAX54_030531, partial [Datura stramonium]|nr:hypothetical protein [Datura stramonium]
MKESRDFCPVVVDVNGVWWWSVVRRLKTRERGERIRDGEETVVCGISQEMMLRRRDASGFGQSSEGGRQWREEKGGCVTVVLVRKSETEVRFRVLGGMKINMEI